jgi:glycerophosphoryl diester phosphodiesterase
MRVPLLLGHRGARAVRHIPENTLASFELCLQHSCDGFEFDVRLCSDGHAVICHDATAGSLSIANTPAKSLALPILQEVLQQFAYRAFLDVELKVAGLETSTLAELRKHPPQKGYVVSSFLLEVLANIHTLDPAVPLGWLCETRDDLRRWPEMPVEWVVPRLDLVNQELVGRIHNAGKKVMVWTVNRAERMLEFAEWGVDAIISDETELMNRSLR